MSLLPLRPPTRTRLDRHGVARQLCTVAVGAQARAWRAANRRPWGALGRPRTGVADDDPLCMNFAAGHDLDGHPICSAHGPTIERLAEIVESRGVFRPVGGVELEGEDANAADEAALLGRYVG